MVPFLLLGAAGAGWLVGEAVRRSRRIGAPVDPVSQVTDDPQLAAFLRRLCRALRTWNPSGPMTPVDDDFSRTFWMIVQGTDYHFSEVIDLLWKAKCLTPAAWDILKIRSPLAPKEPPSELKKKLEAEKQDTERLIQMIEEDIEQARYQEYLKDRDEARRAYEIRLQAAAIWRRKGHVEEAEASEEAARQILEMLERGDQWLRKFLERRGRVETRYVPLLTEGLRISPRMTFVPQTAAVRTSVSLPLAPALSVESQPGAETAIAPMRRRISIPLPFGGGMAFPGT